MSNLKSGNDLLTAKSSLITLEGHQNYFPWWQQLSTHLKTSFGIIGKNIATGKKIELKHPHPGDKPSELAPRVNPQNQKVIKGTLKYERVPPPSPSSETPDALPFPLTYDPSDESDIFNHPLTPASQIKFDKDTAAWTSEVEKHNFELTNLKSLDEACFKYVVENITQACQALIETSKEYTALQECNEDHYFKTRDYLAIASAQFSTGNVLLMTDHVIQTINHRQKDPNNFALHLKFFENRWIQTKASMEDPANPGYASLARLKFAFLLNGIDRETPQNITAVNNYMVAHKNDMLPELLIKELVDQNINSLVGHNKPDPTSDQGSALIANPSSPSALAATANTTYGQKDPTRPHDHCPTCFTVTKNTEKKLPNNVTVKGPFYFYHSQEKCSRKKKIDAAKATKNAAAALLAAGPTSTTPPTLATGATALSDAAHLAIMQSHLQSYQQLCQQQQDALSMMSTSSLHGT